MQSRASRLASALGAAVLILLAAVGAGAAADPTAGGVAAVVVDGRGFGHGVGLSQDGALWMGRAGVDLSHILGQFFPGASLARSGGQVRVLVLSAEAGAAEIVFPDGGQVQDALSGQQSPGFPVRVQPGAHVVLRWSGGAYSVDQPGPAPQVSSQAVSSPVTLPEPSSSTSTTAPASSSTTTAPPGSTTTTEAPSPPALPAPSAPSPPDSTTTTAPASTSTTTGSGSGRGSTGGAAARSTRPLWLVPDNSATTTVAATGRGYRGVLEATADGSALDLVNQLDVETYLRGMAEVQDPSWPLASLQAQVIVERTYALRAMSAAGEMCDDTRCQVYLGVGAEYGAQDRAVSSTAGQVLAYGGRLAATVFSADGGGYSASPEEGFGSTDASYPYLRAAPYYTRDPDPWSTTIALSDVAGRLGYTGTLTSAAVSTVGPSGRALSITLAGSAGPTTVSGLVFEAALGLRSNFFQLHDTVAASPPAPPPPAQPIQALPSDASALAAAVAAPLPSESPRAAPVRAARAPRPSPAGVQWWGWLGLALVAGVGLSAAGVAITAATRRAPE